MAAMNQVMIDTNNGLVMTRSALRVDDDTATFEHLQKFTPDEADQFADALRAGANTARKVQKEKAEREEKEGKIKRKTKSRRRVSKRSKRSKKGNR